MTANIPERRPPDQARPTVENTCAIIVTYFPDIDFFDNLSDTTQQFSETIIVDNGSSLHTRHMLRQATEINKSVLLVENETNLGIAAALNQGIAHARLLNFDWAVTLDQDTKIYPNFLRSLLSIYVDNNLNHAIIGSNYHDVAGLRDPRKRKKSNSYFFEKKTLITSGMLIPLSIFTRVGKFREDYFIDSVDHEFSLRARSHGYRLLITSEFFMSHCIGSRHLTRIPLPFLRSYNHTAKRKYYIARNSTATAIRYFSQEPIWSIRQGWRLLNDFLSIILLEDNKLRKMHAFLVGLAHGLLGKMGPIEKTWPSGKYEGN